MNRAYSLVELLMVLMLSVLLMSSLFLFSFYFWQNHFDTMSYLEFRRQESNFVHWLDQRVRNSHQVYVESGSIKLLRDGKPLDTVMLGPEGPYVGAVSFFNDPVNMTWKASLPEAHALDLEISLKRWHHRHRVWVPLESSLIANGEGEL